MAAVARLLGQEFMPWQEHVALVAGEMIRDEETGVWVPAYPEVFVTVPRQNGKTLLLLSWQLDRAIGWEAYDGKPQAIAYTAQSGSDARKKFRKEHLPMLRASKPLWGQVKRERLAAEDTGLDFRNGAQTSIWATSPSAGHGSTIDLFEMDEIFEDEDDRREQAGIPAMATRRDAQKLMSSTAGTERSVLYLRKQSAGRAAVVDGKTEGIAYFEYSADPKADPEDPKTWRSCQPARGYTIWERTVANALEQMRKEDGDLSEFSRAWLNITKREGGDRVIPETVWNDALANVPLTGQLTVAVDSTPDLSVSSIAVASPHVVEVNKHAAGTAWLLDELETAARTLNAAVAVDTSGPVGYLAGNLKDRGVRVHEFSPREAAHASAEFYTRIGDRKLKVRPSLCDHCGQVPVSKAVEGAIKQPLGDGWRWSRKSKDVDVSPLIAATLAAAAANSGGDLVPFVSFS